MRRPFSVAKEVLSCQLNINPRTYLKLTALCLASYNCNYKKTNLEWEIFKPVHFKVYNLRILGDRRRS